MSTSTPSTPTKTTFGVPSLLYKETPAWATIIATVILYVAGVGNIILQAFPQIPTTVKGAIATYSVEVVTAVHAICNMFGLNPQAPNGASSK